MIKHPAVCQPQTTVSEVFGAIWTELRGTMGSAPTAALLRRAIVISRDSNPCLSNITIEKTSRDYSYNIPQEISESPGACDEMDRFIDTVLSILSQLTGSVLVRQLLENPTIKKVRSKGEQ